MRHPRFEQAGLVSGLFLFSGHEFRPETVRVEFQIAV